MPGHFNPRKSSAHRIAVIALYRALLKQWPRVPLPNDLPSRGPINPIKHFIRKEFKRNIFFTSPRIVVNALKKGYAAGQLLQSAGNGNANSLSQVHGILHAQNTQAIHAAAVTPKPIPRFRPQRPAPYSGAPKVLDVRPLPKEKLTGRRHVPIMAFSDNGNIPFLRFKKPQSTYLGRVLRDKLKSKNHRQDLTERCKEDVALGWTEFEWETIVCDELEREGKFWDDLDWGTNERSWVAEAYEVLAATGRVTVEERGQREKTYERMVEVINKETVLWEEERRQERHEKREAKWVLKKERWEKEAAAEKKRRIGIL